jgi:hypothetical protein
VPLESSACLPSHYSGFYRVVLLRLIVPLTVVPGSTVQVSTEQYYPPFHASSLLRFLPSSTRLRVLIFPLTLCPSLVFGYAARPRTYVFPHTSVFHSICSRNDPESRFLKLDGNLWFSPNSKRTVTVPRPNKSASLDDSMFKDSTLLDDYKHPRWADQGFDYLAFIPLEPIFCGLFEPLAIIPSSSDFFHTPVVGWRLKIAEAWAEAERITSSVTATISNRLGSTTTLYYPPVPSEHGYNRGHATLAIAIRQARRSRDWFVLWMGILAYVMASCGTFAENLDENPPPWAKVLHESQCRPDIINRLLASQLACSPNTARVGCFYDTGSDIVRKSLAFYFGHHIPIWFKIDGVSQAYFAAPYRSALKKLLAPSSEQIQAAKNHFANSASASSESNVLDVVEDRPRSGTPPPPNSGQRLGETWQEFFARRQERYSKIVETEQQRQARENRDRNPGYRHAGIFEWKRNSADVLIRTKARRIEFEELREHYSPSQTRFDAYANEWDFCEEFGEYDRDRETDSEDDYDTPLPPPQSMSQAPPPPPQSTSQALSPPSGPLEAVEYVYKVLRLRLGYVSPLQGGAHHSRSTDINVKDWEAAVTALGAVVIPDPKHFPDCREIMRFIRAISEGTGKKPEGDVWDLALDCRLYINHRNIMSSVQCLSSRDLVLHHLNRDDGFDWSLSVTSVVNLFNAMRLDLRATKYTVARHFLDHGVAFRTLVKLPPTFRPLPPPPDPLWFVKIKSIRCSDTVFTTADYTAYESHRRLILSQVHARAALLKGGIIWRLAREDIGLNDVLDGPSSMALKHGIGFCEDGFLDDELTTEELDGICGVYQCFTGKFFKSFCRRDQPWLISLPGQGGQMSLKSWWPLHNRWEAEAAGVHAGFWSEANEEWYQDRLRKIRAGQAQPITASAWRDKLKGKTRGPFRLKVGNQGIATAAFNTFF